MSRARSESVPGDREGIREERRQAGGGVDAGARYRDPDEDDRDPEAQDRPDPALVHAFARVRALDPDGPALPDRGRPRLDRGSERRRLRHHQPAAAPLEFLSVPGTDSDRARLILQDSYGDRPEGTFTVVFPVDRPGRTARAELRGAATSSPRWRCRGHMSGPCERVAACCTRTSRRPSISRTQSATPTICGTSCIRPWGRRRS